MWYNLARFILRQRIALLLGLLLATIFMGWQASKIQLSYDFTKAIPTDNPKFQEYKHFQETFKSNGSAMVIGIQTNNFYNPAVFNATNNLMVKLKTIKAVQDILSVASSYNLKRDSATEKLIPVKIFQSAYVSQVALDSAKLVFESLPFYKNILYNPQSKAYLILVTLNSDSVNSNARNKLIDDVLKQVNAFEKETKLKTYISGLPFIRVSIGKRIKDEMNWFIAGSFLLSAITLLIFFRSISAMIMSLLVVGFGVVWTLGTMVLLGYKITLLTALIPSLIVVIGVPNCIYFLNKYHLSIKINQDKKQALIQMIGKMGIVTLFCNVAAAIGFIVFTFTRSELLKEFGVVAGINIMMLFFISLIFIPIVLSYLPLPNKKQIQYLDSKLLSKILLLIEHWAFNHRKWVYSISIVTTLIAVVGIFKLKSEGFIVDDLPKSDKIYTDLKWFENNFKGVMPLEITIDTKKKNGLIRSTAALQKIDSLSNYLSNRDEIGKPLSLVDGLKFAKQAYFDGDTNSYSVPYESDMIFLSPYLRMKADSSKKEFSSLISSFIDSNKQVARVSVNMKDIGSVKLPILLSELQKKSSLIFDTANYKVTYTGSSVTFLEGSSFIINGLKESIFWAFILIALCMFLLFRSFKILLCSLIPNLIPLLFTAGLMGWIGITLKPSTVLVFSVALGIVIDVTIRFLINYKQELPQFNYNVKATVSQTIKHTGISIIYTSLVLIAGFIIFCFSSFGGTKGLGWLTSFTLIIGTVTNLVLLPILIEQFLELKKN